MGLFDQQGLLRRLGSYLHAVCSLEIRATVLTFQIGWLALASVALVWLLALLLAELSQPPLLPLAAVEQEELLALAALRQGLRLALAALCLELSPASLRRMAGRLGWFPAQELA